MNFFYCSIWGIMGKVCSIRMPNPTLYSSYLGDTINPLQLFIFTNVMRCSILWPIFSGESSSVDYDIYRNYKFADFISIRRSTGLRDPTALYGSTGWISINMQRSISDRRGCSLYNLARSRQKSKVSFTSFSDVFLINYFNLLWNNSKFDLIVIVQCVLNKMFRELISIKPLKFV